MEVTYRPRQAAFPGLCHGDWRQGVVQSTLVAAKADGIAGRTAPLHRCDGGLFDQPSPVPCSQGAWHEVRLPPPIYVKPFVKPQKKDAADAEAIVEAARRPNLHFVAVKEREHQVRAVTFRSHQCFVRQRTQLSNPLLA